MVKVDEPTEGLGHGMLILSGRKVVITSTAIVLSAYGPQIPSKYDPNGNWTLKPRGGHHANNVQLESSEEEISSFEEMTSDVEEEESYIRWDQN